MKKVFKHRKQQGLEQGSFYFFKLHKEIKAPEGTPYLVFIGPYNFRHSVPAEFYTSYNLEFGKTYLCKVDKINCTGHIFIEPPHPYYRENESYLFRYVKKIRIKHKSGWEYNYYQFKGDNEYLALMDADKNELPEHLKSGFYTFVVTKISKATVYIEFIRKKVQSN